MPARALGELNFLNSSLTTRSARSSLKDTRSSVCVCVCVVCAYTCINVNAYKHTSYTCVMCDVCSLGCAYVIDGNSAMAAFCNCVYTHVLHTCIGFHVNSLRQLGLYELFHLVTPPLYTVELQLITRAKLGLEACLCAKTS